MQLNPYLSFNGQCEAAFTFYAQVLRGKIDAMINHEGTPMAEHVPPEWRKKIMHARMTVGDSVLMGSDTQPDHYEQPRGFSVTIGLNDPAEAERIFSGLVDGGTTEMPMGETFFAHKFGMGVDLLKAPETERRQIARIAVAVAHIPEAARHI